MKLLTLLSGREIASKEIPAFDHLPFEERVKTRELVVKEEIRAVRKKLNGYNGRVEFMLVAESKMRKVRVDVDAEIKLSRLTPDQKWYRSLLNRKQKPHL